MKSNNFKNRLTALALCFTLLLGAAPIEGRLSGVVDIPNSCSTVYIPTAIFDFPVAPSASGPYQIDPGMGAPHSSLHIFQQFHH
mgnify:CR=1 FL=1